MMRHHRQERHACPYDVRKRKDHEKIKQTLSAFSQVIMGMLAVFGAGFYALVVTAYSLQLGSTGAFFIASWISCGGYVLATGAMSLKKIKGEHHAKENL